MTHISYQGQFLEVAPEAAFIWADSMMVSVLDLIVYVHWAQTCAMPGPLATYLNRIDTCVQELKANSMIVDDARILHALDEILPHLDGIAKVARQIRAWQKLHIPQKTITAHNKATRAGGPRQPDWHAQTEFKELLAEFSLHFILYLDALLEFIPIFQAHLPADNATYSEQLVRVRMQIPEIRKILALGYGEAIRIAAAEFIERWVP
jgi:hypothetical protein